MHVWVCEDDFKSIEERVRDGRARERESERASAKVSETVTMFKTTHYAESRNTWHVEGVTHII